MENSYFKNWHNKTINNKIKSLSKIFPVSVYTHFSGIEIKFEDEFGRKINFYLTAEDTEHFKNQINSTLSLLNYNT